MIRVAVAAVVIAVLSGRATADPANHRDERGTRIDFEGAAFVDRAPWFRSTLLKLVGPPTH